MPSRAFCINGQKMKYYLDTYGCQYNEWDSVRLSFALRKLGLSESSEKEADTVFVILCSVRQSAVDRPMGKMKNWNSKKVVVTGCVLEKDAKMFVSKGATIWQTFDIKSLKTILHLEQPESEIESLLGDGEKESSYIPIMKGCNNFCAYCAVPYTRGREVSRSFDEIIESAKKSISAGHKEIWLLGQNVNSYQYNFAKLLEKINELPGVFQIHFTSNHPKDMSDEIIKTIANLPKVAKQIHLPIQTGSDKILTAMNRPYTAKQYLDLIKKIKKIIPDVEISTDVIVGFPGETEADFAKTVQLLKKVGYKSVYINKYSPRSGTKAFLLGDPVPWKEKERRWHILNDLIYKRSISE